MFVFPFHSKLVQRKAQSIIEYAMILALVAGGIMIGGPYVRRSWNAYMQSLDDGIQDSYLDPLDEYSGGGGGPECHCGAVYGSPPETCGLGRCLIVQYRQARDCFPIGCGDNMDQCISSGLCCNDWVEDACGKFVKTAPPCLDNEMAYWRKCGDGTLQTKCVNDGRCGFDCLGIDANGKPLDPNADDWCFPDLHNILLSGETSVTYVNSDDCPASFGGAQCVAKCNPGYTSTESGCEAGSSCSWVGDPSTEYGNKNGSCWSHNDLCGPPRPMSNPMVEECKAKYPCDTSHIGGRLVMPFRWAPGGSICGVAKCVCN